MEAPNPNQLVGAQAEQVAQYNEQIRVSNTIAKASTLREGIRTHALDGHIFTSEQNQSLYKKYFDLLISL